MVLIQRVDVFDFSLTYVHGEYVMSGGRVVSALPSTLVRVTTDAGVAGWGEVCPLGTTYLAAHADGARAALARRVPNEAARAVLRRRPAAAGIGAPSADVRRNGRAIAFALAERLGVVRLVTMHPSDDDVPVGMDQTEFILNPGETFALTKQRSHA